MSIFLIYNCAKFHTKILNDCQDIGILLRGAIFFTHPVDQKIAVCFKVSR
jgi:L-asparaginase II